MKLFLKKFLIFNVIFLLPLFIYPQQRYSVDNKSSIKKRSLSIKDKVSMLKANLISWQKAQKKKKYEKQQAKDVDEYKKKKQTKKVQERMKRSKRKANRNNKKKPRYNFFERLSFKFKAKFKIKDKGET